MAQETENQDKKAGTINVSQSTFKKVCIVQKLFKTSLTAKYSSLEDLLNENNNDNNDEKNDSNNSDVLTISGDKTLHSAISILLENDYRGAPVSINNEYIVLDIRNVVQYVITEYNNASSSFGSSSSSNLLQSLASIVGLGNLSNNDDTKELNTMNMKVSDCVKKTGYKLKIFHKGDQIINVLSAFATGSHIVGIMDDNDTKLIGVLTQGRLFRQIAPTLVDALTQSKENLEILNKILTDLNSIGNNDNNNELESLNMKMCELLKCDKAYFGIPAIYVLSTMKAYNVFKLMADNNVSGVAVVLDKETDDNPLDITEYAGKLCGNTSASDIKLALKHLKQYQTDKNKELPSLDLDIQKYLNTIRQSHVSEKDKIHVAKVHKDEKLTDVIGSFYNSKFHRLFLVDSLKNEKRQINNNNNNADNDQVVPEAIAVLSLTDMFKLITQDPSILLKPSNN